MDVDRHTAADRELLREGPMLLSEQIADTIRDRVRSGEWPAHYKLKAETDLAAGFGVARGTLRRALSVLREEGLLVQVHGRGTFVSARGQDLPLAQRLVTLSEIFAEAGAAFSIDVLEAEVSLGPERIRTLLDLQTPHRLFHLRRRFYADGKAAAIVDNYVGVDRCPQIATVDFTKQALFDVIEHECGLTIDWGQRTFSATAVPEIASLLGIDPDAPLLYIEQITYGGDSPLEYSDVWLDGHSLRIPITLRGRQRAAAGPPRDRGSASGALVR